MNYALKGLWTVKIQRRHDSTGLCKPTPCKTARGAITVVWGIACAEPANFGEMKEKSSCTEKEKIK